MVYTNTNTIILLLVVKFSTTTTSLLVLRLVVYYKFQCKTERINVLNRTYICTLHNSQ